MGKVNEVSGIDFCVVSVVRFRNTLATFKVEKDGVLGCCVDAVFPNEPERGVQLH